MAPRRSTGSAPRSTPLSRLEIVEVATTLIDAEGLAAVTMRRLAEELGVQAPSLYNHMSSKDEILDAVAASVMEGVDVSGFEQLEWRDALRSWAWSYYDALAEHPNLVPHLAVAFGRLDSALVRADQVFAGLRRAGWTPSRATRIAAGIRFAVYGAALASFSGGFGPEAVRFPHLGDVDRMRKEAERVDRAALRLLIEQFLVGLDGIAPDAEPG